MSDTAAELVNLCTTDDTPRRPTKRIRPEQIDPRVLSLVDSDDDAPTSNPCPRDQVMERQARAPTHWGALEDQQAAPWSTLERPVYRPPSARVRRMAGTQQPQANANPNPIVIDDDGDDDSSPASLMRQYAGTARLYPPDAEDTANGLESLSSRGAAVNAASYLIPRGGGRLQQQLLQQQLQQQQLQRQLQQQMQQQQQPGGQDEWRNDELRLQFQQQQLRSRRPAAMIAFDRPMRRVVWGPLNSESQPAALNRGQVQQQQLQPQAQQVERQVPQEANTKEDSEDADMRLAARLQAEEAERLARETAQRLEQEEHRRMMDGRSRTHAAAAAAALVAGAASGPTFRFVREDASVGSDAPAEVPSGRGGEGVESSEAAAAALAVRWSRLDMLETLESANRAMEMDRRSMAVDRERMGRRIDRPERMERVAAAFGPDRDQGLNNLPPLRMGVGMARYGRGAGAGAGDANEAAAAAVAEVGEVAAARPRWSSRSLNDMLPAMMVMPFGLHRILGGRGDADDGLGAQQAYRRARHAAVAAHREQAMAMREQLMAAQRAGIPPHLLLSDRDFTPEDYELLCRLDERVENRKGAKEEQLGALPIEVVGAEGRRRSDGSPATCTICMEEVAPGDVLKRLPCLHDFHGGCIDTWLKAKACCPICQRDLEA